MQHSANAIFLSSDSIFGIRIQPADSVAETLLNVAFRLAREAMSLHPSGQKFEYSIDCREERRARDRADRLSENRFKGRAAVVTWDQKHCS